MFNITCSKCGASMELDLDHIQVYCPYCGNKLSIELDKLNNVLIEKEKTKQIEIEKETTIYKEKEQTERTKISSQSDKTKHAYSFAHGILKAFVIILVAAIIAFVALAFFYVVLDK